MKNQDKVNSAISTKDLNVAISGQAILKAVSANFPQHCVSAIIGPSGGGKSTLLRCFNQIGGFTDSYHQSGEILYFGSKASGVFGSQEELRRRVGMVFQSPCIFPGSILQNVLFGVEKVRKFGKNEALEHVQQVLKLVSLWDEVKTRLQQSASSLSLGQKQRLCLARVLIMEPEIILLDEPTASLDPRSARAIESLLSEIKTECSVILVTHDLQQVRRVADQVAYIESGELKAQGSVSDFLSSSLSESASQYIQEHI